MRTSRGTQALLDFEDSSPDVIFAQAHDGHEYLWPLIRMAFSQAMALEELGSEPVSAPWSRWQSAKRVAKTAGPRVRLPRPAPLVDRSLFISGGVTVSQQTDGSVSNWLIDPLAEATAGQSIVMYDRPSLRKPATSTPVVSLDQLHARSEVLSHRFFGGGPDLAAIRSTVRAIGASFPGDVDGERLDAISRSVTKRLRVSRIADGLVWKLIEGFEPVRVVIEDASYGHRSSLIARLKASGVVVIEPQHGWIGPSHAAYNFGKAMHEGPLAQTLPSGVLTFGDFWSSGIRHPGTAIAIGKPHLDRMRRVAAPLSERPLEVLVVSSVSAPESTARAIVAIRDVLPSGWKVILRTHPAERATQHERYKSLLGQPNIEFDSRSDVLDSLALARVVVGFSSTVLFEAKAMGCRVVVRESPSADLYVGDVFGARASTDVELSNLVLNAIESVDSPQNGSELNYMWKPWSSAHYRSSLEALSRSR